MVKRIVINCDGTWMDGFSQINENFYTNVTRISRAVQRFDDRDSSAEPILQVKYYGAGVGARPGLQSDIDGAVGTGLADKVQEAYSFLCLNWSPGDEVCIFGFSRGAYTARIVAEIVGRIGVLDDPVDLESFASLFLAFQNAGKHPEDEVLQQRMRDNLAPFVAKREAQVASSPGGFLINVLAVWETVGSIGLPQEILRREPSLTNVFGFNDTLLGDHVAHAFQALALNETRADFFPTKFIQTDAGRAKGQTLKQVWFSGSHADLGGGWLVHDLADVALAWMVAQTKEWIAYDLPYIRDIPDRTYPWGTQPPHDPRTGVMALTLEQVRVPPTTTDSLTHEFIHASVREQANLNPAIAQALSNNPALVQPLLPFEEQIKTEWATGEQNRNRPPKGSLARDYSLNATLPVELGQTTPIMQFLYNQGVIRLKNAEWRAYAIASGVVPGGEETLKCAARWVEQVRLEANSKIGGWGEALFGRFFRHS